MPGENWRSMLNLAIWGTSQPRTEPLPQVARDRATNSQQPETALMAPTSTLPSNDEKPKRKKTMTEKQRAANRANSMRSTGPKTDQGKLNIRFNALVGGLTSSQ